MSRIKVKLKRIENGTSRQVTFSKRRNGLIKKAYELSILCDVDISLVVFSPSGRLSHFSGKSKRTEDVLLKFMNLPEHERRMALFPAFGERDEHHVSPPKFSQHLISVLMNHIRCESDITPFLLPNSTAGTDSKFEEFNQLNELLQMIQERLSLFEPDIQKLKSMEELELCEKHLESMLASVKERKKSLMINHLSSIESTCLQGMSNSFENELVSWCHNHAHMFDSSSPSVPIGDDVSALYDPLSQGSSSSKGGWPAKTPSEEYLSNWHHHRHVCSPTCPGDELTLVAPAHSLPFSVERQP